MRIGIDLDNTIVCYDAAFHAAAAARGLIDGGVSAQKRAVKAAVLRRVGNAGWTELQGDVYGALLGRATAFPGAAEFVRRCLSGGHEVWIISHKTAEPARGDTHDLRAAALTWLEEQGWFDPTRVALPRAAVEFHPTRAAKVQAIQAHRCDAFIDDLVEVFAEPDFPPGTLPILFDPDGLPRPGMRWRQVHSWADVDAAVFRAAAA